MTTPIIQFRLDWHNEVDDQPAATMARLRVLVGGRAIWPSEGEPDVSLDIFVDDLLSHLTRFWKPLMLRQTYPLPLRYVPERPSEFRVVARRQWAELPDDAVVREDERVSAFEASQDLSRAFGGLFGLPFLYLLRERQSMLVETPWTLEAVPFVSVHAALEAVGEEIAERLDRDNPDRWGRIVSAWRHRETGDPAQLLAWATSLPPASAKELVKSGTLHAPVSVTEAANDEDELRIAARMSSALPLVEVRQVISLVKQFRKHNATQLDDAAAAISRHVTDDFPKHSPFAQGEAAASFLRMRLGLASVQRADVFDVLRSFGVEVQVRQDGPVTLHGLAVHGPNHGPGVYINSTQTLPPTVGDVENTWFARVTAAHELCHLLLDGEHTLSAVDVLINRVPLEMERRAKAFAGEFLLPSKVAGDKWVEAGRPETVEKLRTFLARLRKTYGVTTAVSAWKLDHGVRTYDVDLRYQLDLIAPHR